MPYDRYSDVIRPAQCFDQAQVQMRDFLKDQASWEKFEALDITLRVLLASWEAYATTRRVAASLEDRS